MRALIYEKDDYLGVGGLFVAGRSLLTRQLQALRDLGIEDVVVEVCDGPHASMRGSFLSSDDPLVARVIVIPSASPLGLGELARRAGLPANETFLAFSADVVFCAEFDLSRMCVRYELTPPRATDLPHAEVTIESLAARAPSQSEAVRGWGTRVTTELSAHELGCAALTGNASGLMIHGAEIKPGVWAARGARIADDAIVHGPVLLGVDVQVLSRAKLGPRVIVGDGSVVERGAEIIDSTVDSGVIVGDGATLRQVRADAFGTTNLVDGARNEVGNSYVLCAREEAGTSKLSRLLAAVLALLLVVPWTLLALVRLTLGKRNVEVVESPRGKLRFGEMRVGFLDVFPGLVDVIAGRRDLLGVNDRRALEVALTRPATRTLRTGAIDISAKLAPGASTSTLLRMWRWYMAHKKYALDKRLWARRTL
jgi:carbonic anhydrase/acetyltransferase-like protein (isoleucine patch superfamily)